MADLKLISILIAISLHFFCLSGHKLYSSSVFIERGFTDSWFFYYAFIIKTISSPISLFFPNIIQVFGRKKVLVYPCLILAFCYLLHVIISRSFWLIFYPFQMFLVIIQYTCEALIYTSFVCFLINKYEYCGGFSLSLIYSISILSSYFGYAVLWNVYYRAWYDFFFCFIIWVYATSAIVLHFTLEDDGILIIPANPILLKDIRKVKIAKLNLLALGTAFGCTYMISSFVLYSDNINFDLFITLVSLGIIFSISILVNKYKLHSIHKRAKVFLGLCMIVIALIIAGPLDFIDISHILQDLILQPIFLYGGIICVLYAGASDLLGCAISELGHNDYELVNDRMMGFLYPTYQFFNLFTTILMYFFSQNMDLRYGRGCLSMIVALFAIVYEGYTHGLRNYIQRRRFEDDYPVLEFGNELKSSEKNLIYSIDEDDL